MAREKPLVTNKVTFLMLPNDLLLNCLARVSRLYYPTLSLVCKSFQSLIASTELNQTRTLLGRTESCLFMSLYFHGDSHSARWFTLCCRPIQITTPNRRLIGPCFGPFRSLINSTREKREKKLSKKPLVSIPTCKTRFPGSARDLVTLGYNIYKIGSTFSSKVSFMDCRSHTWHEAPSMQMARETPILNVIDGKIYVAGGNDYCDSSNWMEFFDPKTQVWKYVPNPDAEIEWKFLLKILALKGELSMLGDHDAIYGPNGIMLYGVGPLERPFGWHLDSFCVLDDIIYCIGLSGKVEWYNSEEGTWRVVKGLKKLPKLPKSPMGDTWVRLADYGGNIAILWENEVGQEKRIWCAEISLKRRSGQKICGKIEWCDVVLSVSKPCELLHFLSVTV